MLPREKKSSCVLGPNTFWMAERLEFECLAVSTAQNHCRGLFHGLSMATAVWSMMLHVISHVIQAVELELLQLVSWSHS